MTDQEPLFEMKQQESEDIPEKKEVEPLKTGEESSEPRKKSVRETAWRWNMLVWGCLFLMGSYYCYDIPAAIKDYLTKPPYNLSNTQYSLLYTVYSIPNCVLPLFGGILLDKIGIRVGLLVFTIILTVGQYVFAQGLASESYGLMLVGRVIFGLGGENMSVAQSAIVANWFKGKELSFSFGLNLSVARLGSVLNGATQPTFVENHGAGYAAFMGLGLCVISLISAFVLVYVDAWAEKKDGKTMKMSEEDKFKFRDILEFQLPYWLLTISCVFCYMTIFPYIWLASDMLVNKFGFDTKMAGLLYSTPYLMSAAFCPFLGLLIDNYGKRAIFITLSSVFIFITCFVTLLLPNATVLGGEDPEWTSLIPLGILGLGYSIYAAAIWGSIPYTVAPRTLGTAFGLTTAVQNIGLTIAPIVQGAVQDATSDIDYGFTWSLVLLGSFSIIGFCFNIWLYIDDIKNRDGQLDKVEQDTKLTEMMTSPEASRREIDQSGDNSLLASPTWDPKQGLSEYKDRDTERSTLKRSMAKADPKR